MKSSLLPPLAERVKEPKAASPCTYPSSPRDNAGYSAAWWTGRELSTTDKRMKSFQWSHPKVGSTGKSTSAHTWYSKRKKLAKRGTTM